MRFASTGREQGKGSSRLSREVPFLLRGNRTSTSSQRKLVDGSSYLKQGTANHDWILCTAGWLAYNLSLGPQRACHTNVHPWLASGWSGECIIRISVHSPLDRYHQHHDTSSTVLHEQFNIRYYILAVPRPVSVIGPYPLAGFVCYNLA